MKRTLQIALCVCLATGGYLAAIRATPAKAQGDLYIDYQTAVDHERQFDAWTMGPRWSGMARATTSRVDVGTLVLRIYDPIKKRLVWRGSVMKTLNPGKDPDKNYRNLEKAIAKLLKNFPPKSGRQTE
jgi:hypothetical protein